MGVAGSVGSQGVSGPTGPPGSDGDIGDDGSPGSPGPVGPSGSAGTPGVAGPIGPPGQDADTPEEPQIVLLSTSLSVNVKQTEVDFGSTPISETEFIVTDSEVTALSQLIGTVAYEAPTGKDLDELEMDAIDLKFAPGTGQFTLRMKGEEGYLEGKFKVNYIIG